MTHLTTHIIEPTTSIDDSKERLLKSLQKWLCNVIMYHKGTKWLGIHDEGTYLTSFRELYHNTKSDKVKDLALERLRANDKWVKRHFRNGYWKKQEVHHGVEHFIIYLNWMYELDPNNTIVRRQLIEASNNIVNPSKKADKTPWYDFKRKRFKSIYLGTKKAGNDYLNVIEHLRLLKLGWLAYAAGGDPKLKQFILEYSNEWVEEILKSDELPLFLNPNKDNTENLGNKSEKQYFKIVGAAPKDVCNKCISEIHIANGTPDILFKLFDLTHEKKYLDSLEKLLKPVLNQIALPYAHPIGPILWKAFSIGLFADEKTYLIQKTIDTLSKIINSDWKNIDIKMEPNINWKNAEFDWLKNNVGMRFDMPAVLYRLNKEDRWEHLPSMGAFYVAYRATNDPKYASYALTLSNEIFNIAGNLFHDGRTHGCSAKTISAFCVGHGRNWGWGYVSTALRMLMHDDFPSVLLPDIEIK